MTAAPDTSYRLAPALVARLVGSSLVTLAGLVAVATVVGLVLGTGWEIAGIVTAVGAVLVLAWAGWLFRFARALHLTDTGYVVRHLGGVGVMSAPWGQVVEAVAAGAQDRPYLVLRLSDGRDTRLPMSALAADRDTVAHDVRRRLSAAHTGAHTERAGRTPADSVRDDQSL